MFVIIYLCFMEKTTKRKIGYKPPQVGYDQHKKGSESPGPCKVVFRHYEKPVKAMATRVIDWLKSHPFFAWGRMCDHLGIDKGNFSRTLNTGTPGITEKNAAKIAGVISKYGFCG